MTKNNIQSTTRELKEKSQDLLKRIKTMQDSVHKTLTQVRSFESTAIEQQKQELARKKAEEVASMSRLTAYVMPDDPIEDSTLSINVKTESAPVMLDKNEPDVVIDMKKESSERANDAVQTMHKHEETAHSESFVNEHVQNHAENTTEKQIDSHIEMHDKQVQEASPVNAEEKPAQTEVFYPFISASNQQYNRKRPPNSLQGNDRPMDRNNQQGFDRRPQYNRGNEGAGNTQGNFADRRPYQQGQGGFADRRPQGTNQGQGGFVDRRPQGANQGQSGFVDRRQGNFGDRRPNTNQASQGFSADRRPSPQGARPFAGQSNNFGDKRPGSVGGADKRPQAFGDKRPGTGPRTSTTTDAATAAKEKVSNYDPNKSNYTRSFDNDKRIKNKKSTIKEAPPSYIGEDERMGSQKRKPRKIIMPKIETIKIEHAVITTENVTIKELSEKIGKPASEIIKKLFMIGIVATINKELDFDTCELIASEYNITLEQNIAKTAEEVMTEAADLVDEDKDLQARPPVVTIMGHVDHGKTSLLDAIRETNVTSGEAGGITQHIGAYTVELNGRQITFLDTPGHEAFTSMRARGAQATDIAVLVVAADDGIMPQTIEAINHAKAANVPIIVAINKMDKYDATPDRVMQQLTEHGLLVEEWGGDTIAVPVSAKTGDNLDKLLEMILLTADIMELKANPNRLAKGVIIEAELDKGRGPVATVLVKNGTLRIGDNIIAGTAYGRVRAMVNDKGERVNEALPSIPVSVLGFNEVPDAGDILNAVEGDKFSRIIAEERKDKIKAEKIQTYARVSLDNLFTQIAEGQVKELNVIIKADVQGSVEAIKQSLEKLTNDEVRVRAIHGGVGAINETDVMFASASNAIIIGFNVRPEPNARDAAEREGVDIRLYRVIYSAIEDIESAMKGLLAPKFKEVNLGRAQVRSVFKVTGVGTVAGCYVQEGKISRNAQLRLVRDGIVILEGKISSLKRFKDDVKEVASGYECGIGIENYNDIKEGDIIEAFIMEEIER